MVPVHRARDAVAREPEAGVAEVVAREPEAGALEAVLPLDRVANASAPSAVRGLPIRRESPVTNSNAPNAERS